LIELATPAEMVFQVCLNHCRERYLPFFDRVGDTRGDGLSSVPQSLSRALKRCIYVMGFLVRMFVW
jgi:hypothetical protein